MPEGFQQQLSTVILNLLSHRDPGKTICPSEAARAVAGEEGDWRALMEPARQAAEKLAADGVLEVAQKGEVVDVATARGPIRLRLVE